MNDLLPPFREGLAMEGLTLQDPDYFISVQLHVHCHINAWESLQAATHAHYDMSNKVVEWIREGIWVEYFFSHFKGFFQWGMF